MHIVRAAVAFSPLRMPCNVFVAWAFKPSDGGWVRVFGHVRTEEDAHEAAEWELLYSREGYDDYEVVRTISFKKKKHGWKYDLELGQLEWPAAVNRAAGNTLEPRPDVFSVARIF